MLLLSVGQRAVRKQLLHLLVSWKPVRCLNLVNARPSHVERISLCLYSLLVNLARNRLRTGVGRFGTRLYHRFLLDTPKCICGAEEQSANHIIFDCDIICPPTARKTCGPLTSTALNTLWTVAWQGRRGLEPRVAPCGRRQFLIKNKCLKVVQNWQLFFVTFK